MQLTIEIGQEEDGRWLGEVIELPGVLAYGETREEALARVQALALRVLADRRETANPRARIAKSTGLTPDDL